MKRLLALVILLGPYAVGCTSQPSGPIPSPAPNLLSPAPEPVAEAALYTGECNVGIIRANHVRPGELPDVLGSYAPSWLPDGFGLLIGFRGSGHGMENGMGAIWTDSTCRQIRLEFTPDAASLESPRPAGRWASNGEGMCFVAPLGDVRCLNYHAQDDGGVLNLTTSGLDRSDAMRVVAGITLSD